ncbi:MAG: EutN/CcmL family microcompartment protein [Bacillota bacterium]|nr:EutN/CcmL family microcompartment protein [Bacillota bacterium]
MIACRVVGTVVCTRKDEKLVGSKLQIVEPISLVDQSPDGKPLVAIDTVGAGEGEIVLVVSGSSARQTSRTQNTPVDAVIMAIVDSIEMSGKLVYRKS